MLSGFHTTSPHQFSVPVLHTKNPHGMPWELTGLRTKTLHGTPWQLTGLRSTSPWDSMDAVPRSTHTNFADQNRYYTSIHHVSRTDQNYAVLNRAENIMRHFEMWSVVRQKETVRPSRKMCSGLKDSVTKSCKFISWVKHHTQRAMLAKEKKGNKKKEK